VPKNYQNRVLKQKIINNTLEYLTLYSHNQNIRKRVLDIK